MAETPSNAQSNARANPLLTQNRAYTMGSKMKARQMFIYGADGRIVGVKDKPAENSNEMILSPTDKFKERKFGKMSSGAGSVSGFSIGGETKLAFSDANYLPSPGQTKPKRIFKMLGKPGVSLANLFTVPGTLFFSMLTGATVIQSSILLLKDPEYYDIADADRVASISSNSQSYAVFVCIPLVIVAGFLFDLLGRKIVMVSTFIVGALFTFLMPLVAPSIILYDLCRIVVVNTLIVAISNPFINDYVQV